MRILLLLLVVVVFSGANGQLEDCPDGWHSIPPLERVTSLREAEAANEVEGPKRIQCIKQFEEKLTWFQAKAVCIKNKAHLVEINSPHESDQVARHANAFGADMYWMGGNDLATKNKWAWSSVGYRIYPYVNWKNGFPAESNGNCIALEKGTFWWMNLPCETKHEFFCEMNIVKETQEWKREVSFDGDGYMDLNKKIISHDVNMKWELTVEFSTWLNNGLLIWRGKQSVGLGGRAADDDDSIFSIFDTSSGNDNNANTNDNIYAALGIKDSKIVFVSNGIQTSVDSVIVNDGKPHTVVARKEGTTLTLEVDGVTNSGEYPSFQDANMMADLGKLDLFLGGLPDNSLIGTLSKGVFTNGFSGCIHHLDAYNKPVDSGKGPSYGAEVKFGDHELNKKSRGVTSSEQCLMPAKPTNRPPFVEPTTPTPFIQQDVTFDGQSYIQLQDDIVPLQYFFYNGQPDVSLLEINMEITTQSPQGPLLWYGQRSSFGGGSYISLSVYGGYLRVDLDFGNGDMTASTSVMQLKVDDGQKHIVSMIIYQTNVDIRVDGNVVQGLMFGDQRQLPGGNLFIGGVPDSSMMTGGLFSQGFYGCIHSLEVIVVTNSFANEVMTKMVNLAGEALPTSRFNQGLQCNALTPRPTSRPPFAATTTTTTTTTTTPYQCNFAEGSFSGMGYARLRDQLIGKVTDTELEIKLSFSTFASNGLLLWQGRFMNDGQWIAIGVKNGYIEYEQYFGGGRSLYLRSRNVVNDGQTHNAVIRHRETRGFLTLDGDQVDTQITGDPYFSVKRRDLFLGGHKENIFDVTNSKYANAFDGCIYSLGILHYRLPGRPGAEKYGQESIPMTNDNLVLELNNVRCTQSCRPEQPFF